VRYVAPRSRLNRDSSLIAKSSCMVRNVRLTGAEKLH